MLILSRQRSCLIPVDYRCSSRSLHGPILFLFLLIIFPFMCKNEKLKCMPTMATCIHLIKFKCVDNLELTLQQDLDDVVYWCNLNKIKLNSGKTSCLLFGSNNTLNKCTQNLHSNIEKSETACVKCLGVLVDR